jgi:hypothetical protein
MTRNISVSRVTDYKLGQVGCFLMYCIQTTSGGRSKRYPNNTVVSKEIVQPQLQSDHSLSTVDNNLWIFPLSFYVLKVNVL